VVTHEYTLLFGATVLPGGGEPACEALAWAAGTILALGTEAEIQAVSRGDSHVMTFPGTFVVPLEALLEVGGAADLVVYEQDPRQGHTGDPVAILRAGHIVVEEPADER
jgi:predicted amidohydrolase YtcJ